VSYISTTILFCLGVILTETLEVLGKFILFFFPPLQVSCDSSRTWRKHGFKIRSFCFAIKQTVSFNWLYAPPLCLTNSGFHGLLFRACGYILSWMGDVRLNESIAPLPPQKKFCHWTLSCATLTNPIRLYHISLKTGTCFFYTKLVRLYCASDQYFALLISSLVSVTW